MSETLGNEPQGGNRCLILQNQYGQCEDITDFLRLTEDRDAAAFEEANVLLDFDAMNDGDVRVMEYEATNYDDIVGGVPPQQIIFRRESGRFFASFASCESVEDLGTRDLPEFEIEPVAAAMAIHPDHTVIEDGPPRIKEGYSFVFRIRDGEDMSPSLRFGSFVDPWSDSQRSLGLMISEQG